MVTLLGWSAGSISAGLHILDPASKGLFHKVILQSGQPTDYYLTKSMSHALTTVPLARSVGCPVENTTAMFSCLQNMDASKLIAQSVNLQFYPVVDGDVIPEQPVEIYRKKTFSKVPHIIGYTSGKSECAIFQCTLKAGILQNVQKSLFFNWHMTEKRRVPF